MLHRLRKAAGSGNDPPGGPVGVDETDVGGRRRNMPSSKRKQMTGRGGAGRRIIVGARGRGTGEVTTRTVPAADRKTLQGFVDRTLSGARPLHGRSQHLRGD